MWISIKYFHLALIPLTLSQREPSLFPKPDFLCCIVAPTSQPFWLKTYQAFFFIPSSYLICWYILIHFKSLAFTVCLVLLCSNLAFHFVTSGFFFRTQLIFLLLVYPVVYLTHLSDQLLKTWFYCFYFLTAKHWWTVMAYRMRLKFFSNFWWFQNLFQYSVTYFSSLPS